jgi:hypothetical protein
MRLIAATALSLAAVGCGPTRPPETVSQPQSCEQTLALGKKLEAAGADAEALKTYAPCLDSLVPAVALLGKRYAAAVRLLRQRQSILNERIEKSLAQGREPPLGEIELLIAYNSALGESTRSLLLLDRIAANSAFFKTAGALNELLWQELVVARRYRDALKSEPQIRAGVDAWLVISSTADSDQALNQYALRNAALYAEALAGTGQSMAAQAILQEAGERHPKAKTYTTLIEHAARAGDMRLARVLRADAAKRLNADEMKAVDDVLHRFLPHEQGP